VNRSILVPLLLVVACSLAGCMTSGGNIKGDFQCAAPGGTCAPMSSIDAAAISAIGGFRAVGQPGIESQRVPHGVAGPVLADGSAPARTSDRVLRVVFPAHIDADGIYREQSAAHAVVEDSAWTAALAGEAGNGRGTPSLRAAGIVPTSVPAAAPASALATLDEVIAARAAQAQGVGGSAAPIVATSPVAPPVAPVAAFVPSRATAPGSLAEVASGLSAPRVTSLDPRAPASNFDTPDVVAAVSDKPQPAPPLPSRVKVVSIADDRASVASPGATSEAAPYGSRPVRWKGKTYQLPYKTPQVRAPATTASASGVPSSAPSPSPGPTTASLNSGSLAKVEQDATAARVSPSAPFPALASPSQPAAYPATSDAGVAQARVRAMATPLMQSAAESSREALRAQAPQGLPPLSSLKDAPQ
jgi:conjugal transfer pilus assembly protein TraV